ncbi:hypothetical protein SESBI_38239 [Sesbania bispinosa]|nr:hypothetical protein SESBI_38239 [Sesbania bispinosa]
MNAFTRGRAEDEDAEAGLGKFHLFSPEIVEAQFPEDFREPILKDYDGTTDPQDVYQHDLLKLPPPAEEAKGPDLNKWCDYHRAKGHDTENCWTLMNKIEQLIKEGFLGRYMERRRSNRGARDEGGSSGRGNYNKRRREDGRCDEKEEAEEIRGVVTTIAKGFCGDGETSSARKKYVRSVMSTPTTNGRIGRGSDR